MNDVIDELIDETTQRIAELKGKLLTSEESDELGRLKLFAAALILSRSDNGELYENEIIVKPTTHEQ